MSLSLSAICNSSRRPPTQRPRKSQRDGMIAAPGGAHRAQLLNKKLKQNNHLCASRAASDAASFCSHLPNFKLSRLSRGSNNDPWINKSKIHFPFPANEERNKRDSLPTMTIREVLITVLAAVVYSGPVIPLGTTLFFRKASHERFRHNLRALIVCATIQFAFFLPCLFGIAFDRPDSVRLLSLPFFSGALFFIISSIYAIAMGFGV